MIANAEMIAANKHKNLFIFHPFPNALIVILASLIFCDLQPNLFVRTCHFPAVSGGSPRRK